jgi:sulfur-oxidizing protein SoxY
MGTGKNCDGMNSRRRILLAGLGAGTALWIYPALAWGEDLQAAILGYTGGATPQAGRVMLDIAALVDNGNTVPVTISVDSPVTAADHVRRIALFNERNPQRDMVRFELGARAGKTSVSTRVRLATSQKLVALAECNDGSYWSHTVDVVVTLAACIEGDV